MPCLPILAPPSNVGNRDNSAVMAHENDPGNAKAGRQGDIEAPVSVQQRGMALV